MKHLLLILSIFFCLNSGFTQENRGFDRSQNFQLVLRQTSPATDFFSQPLQIPAQPEAAFFTLAVFVPHEFFGNLFIKINEQDWQLLLPYHEANHPDRTIFNLRFLPNETTNLHFKSDQTIPSALSVRWLALTATDQLRTMAAVTNANLREDCNCPQPDICGRDCWCPAGDCPTDATPVATAPSHIIVHHSASASTSNDFAAVVRSYWDFHVNINGWDDIGYNWLIDGEGVIYEGRGSGTQGAHFSCMNTETTGICMIGNFENSTPTPDAINSLENMIAWEACDKTIVPADSSNHITSGALLAHISGHRDGNDLPNSCTNTVCPGANLYPLLSGIRQRVTDNECLNDLVNIQNNKVVPFQIFPNPSKGELQLSGDLDQIKSIFMYSEMGREKQIYFQPDGRLKLENAGFYILKIINKNGSVTTHKLLIQK